MTKRKRVNSELIFTWKDNTTTYFNEDKMLVTVPTDSIEIINPNDRCREELS